MTDPPRYAPGTELADGRYRLERVLGRGGMAAVWLARDRRLDRPVAIKVIADTIASDPDYLRRFAREARLAAGISHRNLVDVYDFSDAPPFLVMEHVDGGTLADRPPPDATAVARDLLGALDAVHRAGILHRDLKPANVLMGRDGRARLTDFGIAQAEDATRLTRTGQVIGTLRYMAPEVTRGEPATPRSDLYSLGQVVAAIGGPAPLVRALTATDPAARPATAADALRLLEEATTYGQAPEPTRTEPRPTRPMTPADPPRRSRSRPRPPRLPRPARPPGATVPRLLALAGIVLLLLALVSAIVRAGDDGATPLDRRLDRIERQIQDAVR